MSNVLMAIACLYIGRCTADFDCPRVVARTTAMPSPSGLVADHRVTAGDLDDWLE